MRASDERDTRLPFGGEPDRLDFEEREDAEAMVGAIDDDPLSAAFRIVRQSRDLGLLRAEVLAARDLLDAGVREGCLDFALEKKYDAIRAANEAAEREEVA